MKRSVILVLCIAVGGVAVLAGGAALWRWRISHRTVYTDGQTIKQPIRHALVRDVLWEPPKALPASINSAAQESQPLLSADGLSLYFVRRDVGGRADIFLSTRRTTADENWSEPQPIIEINTPDDETSPVLSADGQSLFFCSNRPGGFGGDDLWVSQRGELSWQPPVNLGPAVNTEFDEREPAVSNSRTALYFSSNRPHTDAAPAQTQPATQQRDHDLYVASILNTGEILPAAPLTALNSPDDDRSPAISPASDFLYFSSNRPGSRGGFDLYRAWLVRGELQTPINLGVEVNTAADERDPAICLAGFGLYFSSDRIVDVMDTPAQGAPRDANLYCTTSREVFTEVEPAGPLVDWASMWALLGPTILWLLLGIAAVAMLAVIAKRLRSGKLSLLARCLLASLAAHLLIMVLLTFWRVTTSLAHIVQSGEIKIAMSSGGSDALAAQIRGELTAIVPAPARGDLNRAQGDVAMEPAQAAFALATAKQEIPLESSSVQLNPDEAPIPDRPATAPVPPSVEVSAAPPVAAPADAARLAMAEARQAPPAAQTPEQVRDRAADPLPALQASRVSSAALQPQHATDKPADRSLAAATATDAPSASSVVPKPALEKLADAQAATVSIAAPRESAPQQTAEVQPTSPTALAQQDARDRTTDANPPVQPGSTTVARISPKPDTEAGQSNRTLAAVASAAESTAASPLVAKPLLDAPQGGTVGSASIAVPREGTPKKTAEAQPSSPSALAKQGGREHGSDAVPAGSAAAITSARVSPKRQQGSAADNQSLAAESQVGDSAAASSTGSNFSLEQFAAAGPANAAAIALPRVGATQQVAEAQPGVASTSGSSQRASASNPTQFASTPLVAAALAPARQSAAQQTHSERSLASDAIATPSDSPAAGTSTSGNGAVSLMAVADGVPSASIPAMQAPASGTAAPGGPVEAEVRVAAQSASLSSAQGGIAMGAVEPARSATAAIAPATQPASSSGSALSFVAVSAAISQSGAPDLLAAAGGRAPIDASLSDLPSATAPAIGIPAANESAIAAAGDSDARSGAPSAVGGGKDRRADYVLARQAVHDGGISIAPSSAATSSAKTDSSFARVNERALGEVNPGSSASSDNSTSMPMADVLSSGIPAMATATVATPQGANGNADAHTEPSDHGTLPVGPSSGRVGNAATGLVKGESKTVAIAPQSMAGAAPADSKPSLSSGGVAPQDSPIILASASNAATAGGDAGDVGLPAIDVRVPTEATPLANPYVARTEDKRMEIVKKMGGSEATERAVSLALKWLAAHQSPDGRWAAKDFDDRCGECGGLAKFDTDIATTGLALLCFLGADHTHAKDGPYRQNVERGLNWLLQQQKPDGDLRGAETMYSHGIGTIAISESFGMTGDPKLLEPLKNAIDFIGRARNRRTGGWRYEPGQVGDTSVLGWQVMAMVSAKRAGLAIPAEALDSARQWLEVVGTATKPGLYAYQPGQRYSPSMTAEGMFVQQLLGMDHEDARMQASAEFVMQNPPRWNNDPNSYYWYYATLALFQYQGDAWKVWNKNITDELLANQRPSGAAAGSWDPVDNWSKIGGRIYQTAVCTLCLEVYYRYLPMYAAVKTDEAENKRD